MRDDIVRYPVFQVRPSGLLIYERVEWLGSYNGSRKKGLSKQLSTGEEAGERNTEFYTGQLTKYAKKRLKRAIELLVASSVYKEATHFKTGKKFKFKVNFITLTLPAAQKEISDKELKSKCLDVWIKRAKRKYGLKSYVWRAERQKNGNIHFHIMSDCYIRYDKIRDDWNSVLSRYHFIDDFYEQHGHRRPNSTDVHAVSKIRNLAAYMVKYMSKEEKEGDKIEGKVWDCSVNLKTKDKCEMWLDEEELEMWNKALEDPETRKIEDDRYTLIGLNSKQFRKYVRGEPRRKYEEFLRRIREGTSLMENST